MTMGDRQTKSQSMTPLPRNKTRSPGIAGASLSYRDCLRRRRFLPKLRLDPEFVLLVDQDDQVMNQHFAKHLVDHAGIALAPNVVAELPFDG